MDVMLRHRLRALIGLASLCFAVAAVACGSDDPQPDDEDGEQSAGAGASSGSSGSTSSGVGGSGPGSGPASSSSSGGPASSGSGSGGCTMGLGDACSDCAAASCNALYCSCYGNPACGALAACAAACAAGDTQCAQACLSANPSGISDALTLGDCASSACAQQCPTATALSPCESCAFENCASQMNACVANAECTALIACVQDCGGDDFCNAGCYFDHEGGQDGAQAVQDCVAAPCPACG
jgi:hypothetical protein